MDLINQCYKAINKEIAKEFRYEAKNIIRLLDNDKLNPVFNTTILAIQDLTVTLNNVISQLSVAGSARLVKLLGAAAVPPPARPWDCPEWQAKTPGSRPPGRVRRNEGRAGDCRR